MRRSKRLKATHDVQLELNEDDSGSTVNWIPTTANTPSTTPQHSTQTSPYTAIDSEKGDIRLLELGPGSFDDTIVLTLLPQNLLHSAERSYEALSYVWGDEICPLTALLNGIPVSVTTNLDCALRHLRFRLTTRILWVDALSMNQQDVQERNHQVRLMGQIYANASAVIVWLGPVEQGDLHLKAMVAAMQFSFVDGRASIGLFDYVCSVISMLNDLADVARDARSCTTAALYQLISRPWFYRVWVVQELALSKTATVHIGAYSFPWSALEQFVKWLPYYKVDLHKNYALKEAAARVVKLPPENHLLLQLRRTLDLSAKDPRDKVFGILGISNVDSSTLQPDYAKSVTSVFTETVALLLREKSASIYCWAPLQPPGMHLDLKKLADLPSWVPDLRIANAVRQGAPAESQGDMWTNCHSPSSFLMKADMFEQQHAKPLVADMLTINGAQLAVIGLPVGKVVVTSSDLLVNIYDHFDDDVGLPSNFHQIYKEIAVPHSINERDLARALSGLDHVPYPELDYQNHRETIVQLFRSETRISAAPRAMRIDAIRQSRPAASA